MRGGGRGLWGGSGAVLRVISGTCDHFQAFAPQAAKSLKSLTLKASLQS